MIDGAAVGVHRGRVTDASEILIDARGHRYPVPTLKLRRALEAAPAGARLRLLADDPMARVDVPHFLAQAGRSPPKITTFQGALSFLVLK